MQRIADASTPEGHVAHKAYRRIGELVDELKLDEGHTELAQQASANSTTMLCSADRYHDICYCDSALVSLLSLPCKRQSQPCRYTTVAFTWHAACRSLSNRPYLHVCALTLACSLKPHGRNGNVKVKNSQPRHDLQTAEILMMLRPEGEAASDFQDYTLVAVIAVAAHLCGTHVGDHHFIAALAQRFSQDTAALQQVSLCALATWVCAALGSA